MACLCALQPFCTWKPRYPKESATIPQSSPKIEDNVAPTYGPLAFPAEVEPSKTFEPEPTNARNKYKSLDLIGAQRSVTQGKRVRGILAEVFLDYHCFVGSGK